MGSARAEKTQRKANTLFESWVLTAKQKVSQLWEQLSKLADW